ncbi:MAG: hypothetical protein Q8P99_01050 [bacterium]|nr:hypothetical protein [bacterium]
MKHPMERPMERDTFGSVPEDLAGYYESARKGLASLRRPRIEFEAEAEKTNPGRYDPKEVKRDWDAADKERAEHKGEFVDVEVAELAEAVLSSMPIEAGWFGEDADVYTVASAPHDDQHGVDLVREAVWKDENGKTRIVRWAEDITTAHPDSSTDMSRASKVVRDKVERIMGFAREGKDTGFVKYFASEVDPQLVKPTFMPKAIVSLPRDAILELADLHQRAREGDETALEKLRTHWARSEYLTQLDTAFASAQALSTAKMSNTRNERERDFVGRTVSYLSSVRGFLKRAGLSGDEHLRNEWLRDNYTEAIDTI